MKPGKLVLAFALAVGLMKPALAVENQYLDGRAFDPAKLEPAEPACDAYCELVVDKAGKAKNLTGDGGWAEPDDQWCANHAVGTNPAVVAVPPTGNKPNTPCNLPLLPGDGSCVDVNRRIQQCKLRGSQVETKCAAYTLMKEAGKFEKVVMGLDTAAAAS
ncbi:MAG TPA: hypothetical protein VM598_01285, partial [Bdellovibrionota bacterium]|nr:hypothetical protein [Bdellovibrionota bacterium]